MSFSHHGRVVATTILVLLSFSSLNNNNRRTPILDNWCYFLTRPDHNIGGNDHVDERRSFYAVSAFSINSNDKSSSSQPSTTTTINRRRRDFLMNIVNGGGTMVVATATMGPSVSPAPAFAASPSIMAAFDNNSTSSSNTLIMGSRAGGRKFGALANRIRAVGNIMDELQRDLMQERWDLVETYPMQLRSYVPVFTTYTDSAFPSADSPVDKGLRVALRYEVGRFFAALERFKQASVRRSLDEAYIAYSEMSLHLDRYMRVGGVYTYYDDMITTEVYFVNTPDEALVYANRKKDPPLVRDLVVLITGPDKGKTGIMIGLYQDGSETSVVKLDRYKGMREIRLVPNAWVAKRLGEQAPDDVFLIPRK